MALTKAKLREILSKAGVDTDNMAEAVDAITAGHVASIEALKEERDTYKADAEKLPAVQKELDDAKKMIAGNEKDPYKVKYEAIKEDFESYKREQQEKATRQSKQDAYKGLLKKAGVSDKRLDAILRITDLESVELDADGNIKGADDLEKNIKTEWADFIVTGGKQGASTSTPPSTVDGTPKMTKAEIYKKDEHGKYIMSASERQKALVEMANN